MTLQGNTFATQVKQIVKKVFYTGTDALARGEGLCYDHDYGTATAWDGSRTRRVERPSATNGNTRFFAGVVVDDHAANAAGQWIEIYEPGSYCQVLVGRDTAINATLLGCSATAADAGRFTDPPVYGGRGAALAMQTNTSGSKFQSLDGTAASHASTAGQIVKTGIGTASAVNDLVFVIGAEVAAECQKCYVKTIVDADNIIVATTIGGTAVAFTVSKKLAVYVVDGSTPPLVMAYLCTGMESGLQHWSNPVTGAAAVPAPTPTGMTYVFAGTTIANDTTATLANGIVEGERKGYRGMGALTTGDYVVTVTAGTQVGVVTDLATEKVDAADEVAILEWVLNRWQVIHQKGATAA